MTTTPPDAPSGSPGDPGEPGPPRGPADPSGPDGPRVTRDEVRDLGRLRRTAADRKVAGVAGGLARHLDIDPVILRVAFVVLAFFGGAGVIVYLACWALVPDETEARAVVHLDERNRTVALLVVGVVAALTLVGDSWGFIGFPWQLVVLALVAVFLLSRTSGSASAPPAGTPGTPTGPPTAYGAAYGPAYGPVPDPAYAAQPAAPWGGAPPDAPWTGPVAPLPPRNPRRRGPVLFWFTLALAALGVGVLGLVEASGAAVAGSAYPALVVAVCGGMLLVGAFYGRGGGLILVGLLAALVMAGSTIAEEAEHTRETVRPLSSEQVADNYDLNAGELTVDLTGVADPEALEGRTLTLEGGIGMIEVLVPADLDVLVTADVGVGSTNLFGHDRDGLGVSAEQRQTDDGNTPLTLDVDLGVGEIRVSTETGGDRR